MKALLATLAVLFAVPAFADETTSVYFDTAKSTLSQEANVVLDKVVAEVKGDDLIIQVNAVGTADARTFTTNVKLGQARADAVKAALVARGVDASMIKATTTGDTKATAAKTAAREALAKDRRVDITYLRKLAPIVAACPVVEPLVFTKTKEVVKTVVVEVEKPSPWEIMAFGQFGVHKDTHGYNQSSLITQKDLHGKFNNWGVWQFGTEFHYVPLHLGLRTQAGNNGFGAIAQVFPVQGRLNWYIGPGLGYTSAPFYRPTAPEVQRYWDIQLWTGLEYALTPHLIGLVDVRADLPMSWTNGNGLTGKQVGDALKQTAVLVGLGYRF